MPNRDKSEHNPNVPRFRSRTSKRNKNIPKLTQINQPYQPNIKPPMPIPPKLLKPVHKRDAALHIVRDLNSVKQRPDPGHPPNAHKFQP